jgi:hypothetical protein
MCWTSNNQNTYRNGPRAHFPLRNAGARGACAREEERGGRERERERERGGELTLGSKSDDHRLQNLGHNEGEREVERKLLREKKIE